MTRAWVEIDLGALCRNGAAVAARAGVPLLPMVKADGYGIGALRAALALEAIEPWGFGVATVTEGDELRRGGITRPIIVFTPILRTEIDVSANGSCLSLMLSPSKIEGGGTQTDGEPRLAEHPFLRERELRLRHAKSPQPHQGWRPHGRWVGPLHHPHRRAPSASPCTICIAAHHPHHPAASVASPRTICITLHHPSHHRAPIACKRQGHTLQMNPSSAASHAK